MIYLRGPHLYILAAIAVASFASGASAADNTIHSTRDSQCGPQLRAEYGTFLKRMRSMNFKSGAASGGKEAARLQKWLEKTHKEVVKHERDHAKAQGKYHTHIEYMYYTWMNRKYAVAGCAWWKGNMPLVQRLKSALAPKQPSSYDLAAAKQIKKQIKIKKARNECHKIRKASKKARCLKPYGKYKWLDRVKLR